MEENLLDLKAKILLEKFGAGEHKPGSGSAAAYQGMLAAQLIKTVISLTTDQKRKNRYQHCYDQLKRWESDINSRIYPNLEHFFQKDSEIFDQAIQLRISRDKARNRKEKDEFAEKALEQLKLATEMPVAIAELCLDLARYGLYIFDNGFSAVRGDSGVALNAALSGVGGCLSVIDLNLTSFPRGNWTKRLRLETDKIRKVYTELNRGKDEGLIKIQKEADLKNSYLQKINFFNSLEVDDSKITYEDIEAIARKLQNILWINKDLIWAKNIPPDPLEVLQPEKILKILGYKFHKKMSLGQFSIGGKTLEVAGLIDKENKIVSISEQFPLEVQKFTAAHEIGHALLHNQTVLHRDKALNGSNLESRDIKEIQADKFASFFLMPAKQVEKAFQDIFKMEKFLINDDTKFLLNLTSYEGFKKKYKNIRGLTRYFASTETFDRRNFQSLAKLFGVSVETMAIRLEELNLVEFNT